MWLTPLLGFDVARWLVTLAGLALLAWAARARRQPRSVEALDGDLPRRDREQAR